MRWNKNKIYKNKKRKPKKKAVSFLAAMTNTPNLLSVHPNCIRHIISFQEGDLKQWNNLRAVCRAFLKQSTGWIALLNNPVFCRLDEHISALEKFCGLQKLFLWRPPHANTWDRLTSLTDLSMGNTEIRDIHLHTMSQLTRLRCLRISGCRHITDEGIQTLTTLHLLTELDVSSTWICGVGLTGLTTLESLELQRCPNISQLFCLSTLVRLHTLYLDGYSSTFNALSSLTALRTLSLPDTKFADDSVVYLSALHGLRTLMLSATPFTDQGLTQLVSLVSNLTRLELWDCENITGRGLNALNRLQLTSLNIRGHELNAKIAWSISHITTLAKLDISHTPITDRGLENLMLLTSLQELDLAECCDLTSDAFSVVASFLTNLRVLDVTHTSIDDIAVQTITSLLTELRELDLDHCLELTDLAFVDISQNLPFLKYLMIGSTCITDVAIEHNIRFATTLQYLNLQDCDNITDDGIQMLSSLSCLKRLWLPTQITKNTIDNVLRPHLWKTEILFC